MATMALPISEMTPVIGEAKAETKCVVVCSRKETSVLDSRTLWNIACKTLGLKRRLANVVTRQDKIIAGLVACDFSTVSEAQIADLATNIDTLVKDEYEILSLASDLGSEIRFWWRDSLARMTAQLDYFESISESLHVAVDPEASALLALSVEQLALQ